MTDRWGGGGRNLTWSQLRAAMVGDTGTEMGKSRPPKETTADPPPATVPDAGDYAELHVHSNFSFLDGASSPEALVAEARRQGLAGLAITDHDGLYGAVRFHRAAEGTGLLTVYGAELTLDADGERTGVPDPPGRHLLVLARGAEGYARLSRLIGQAHLDGGGKGRPDYGGLEQVAEALRDWAVVLTGCRKSTVRRALSRGPDAVRRELERLVELFGAEAVVVELIDHRGFVDDDHNQLLYALAGELNLRVVATNNVHYARVSRHRLSHVVSAIRANLPLSRLDGWLPTAGAARLHSPSEMAEKFAHYPQAVANSLALARELAFDLKLIAPGLPPFPLPSGHDAASWLRRLAHQGGDRRYGTGPEAAEARRRLEYELDIITGQGYPGYFLIVHEIVAFCESRGILVQGRGSAANSVVCFCLGITKADPVRFGLLFERFLSPGREGPPDIDLDIEARRREEVIQHVYRRYGREHTALVANVITYRRRSAVRDVALALGYSPGQVDGWSAASARRGGPKLDEVPADVGRYARQLERAPRHLGIHSGGMVICDRPVIDVVPVEHARMADRTVVQWDKDDCADQGLIKFDLLGLGMLTALQEAARAVRGHYDERFDLAEVPADDAGVYAMVHAADCVGTFQIESRAQMQLAPRLLVRSLHDLAVQIALVRPGPIQGGAVHPYIRRRRGEEEITYPHASMTRALQRTLGVPLFQEQMMAIAIDCAGFNPAEADELRQAMGAKRSIERMRALKERFRTGAAAKGLTGDTLDELWSRLEAFSGYGFPESHAVSFAYLAYASCYLKRYYPAAFLVGLIRAQPMGFYSVNTLVDDARRHGVTVHGVHVNDSGAVTALDGDGRPGLSDVPPDSATTPAQRAARAGTALRDRIPGREWGLPGPAVRLGLDRVRGIDTDTAERIAAGQPYTSLDALAEHARLSRHQLENLATAGALDCFGLTRRQALWTAHSAVHAPGALAGAMPVVVPTLPTMSDAELTAADMYATGTSPTHPIAHVRHLLDAHGAVPIERLPGARNGCLVIVGGLVTHRQAPETANGVIFLNLEDETGHANIVCPARLRAEQTRLIHTADALMIAARLENRENAITLTARTLTPLHPPATIKPRNFR